MRVRKNPIGQNTIPKKEEDIAILIIVEAQ
jgi:hypothetical protein